MSATKHRIPFAFAPVPRRAFEEFRDGDLTTTEWRVLACLYERANLTTWTASFRDLEVVARAVAWEHSLDYLSKVLRSLRAKRLIAFESRRGPNSPYTIGLCTDWSETRPKLSPRKGRTSELATRAARPKLGGVSPKLREHANRVAAPTAEHSHNGASPKPSDVSEDPSPRRTEENVVGALPRAVDATFTSEEEAQMDRLWAETASSARKPPWG